MIGVREGWTQHDLLGKSSHPIDTRPWDFFGQPKEYGYMTCSYVSHYVHIVLGRSDRIHCRK